MSGKLSRQVGMSGKRGRQVNVMPGSRQAGRRGRQVQYDRQKGMTNRQDGAEKQTCQATSRHVRQEGKTSKYHAREQTDGSDR